MDWRGVGFKVMKMIDFLLTGWGEVFASWGPMNVRDAGRGGQNPQLEAACWHDSLDRRVGLLMVIVPGEDLRILYPKIHALR